MNKDLSAEEQMISALPDIRRLTLTNDDEFMVLACDGIWNFMTSEDVVKFVKAKLTENSNIKLTKICEELFDHCLAPNTLGDGTGCDNMTAIIIKFNKCVLTDSGVGSSSISCGTVETRKRSAADTDEATSANESKRMRTADEGELPTSNTQTGEAPIVDTSS